MDGKEIYDRLKAINYDINKIDCVVYHHNCPDGFGSAWIIWRHLKTDATYYGITPDRPPSISSFKKKYVVFVDVSFPKEYIEQVKEVASNVLIIDHHQTYGDYLMDEPHAIFDNTHSAIYITWRVFNPDQKMPQFIRYIEDNDLTTNKLSKTEAFTAALGTKLSFHHIDFFKTWINYLTQLL